MIGRQERFSRIPVRHVRPTGVSQEHLCRFDIKLILTSEGRDGYSRISYPPKEYLFHPIILTWLTDWLGSLADPETLFSADRDGNCNRCYHDWCLRGSGVFCLHCTKSNLVQGPAFSYFSGIKRDRRHCGFSHLQPRGPGPDLQYPCKQAKSSSP